MSAGVPAERLAADMIRSAYEQGVRVDVQHIADQTALTPREVEAIRVRLLTPSSPAKKPEGTPIQVVRKPPPDAPGDLIVWALGHPDPAIRREAENAVEKVRATIAARATASRIAELKAELAQLRGPRAERAREACPDCGTLVSAGYLPQHRMRSALHTEAVAR